MDTAPPPPSPPANYPPALRNMFGKFETKLMSKLALHSEPLCRATQNGDNDILITMFPGTESREIITAIERLTLAEEGVALRMHFYTDTTKTTTSETAANHSHPPPTPSKHSTQLDFLELFTAMQDSTLALRTTSLYLRWSNATASPMLFLSILKLFPNLASATIAPPDQLSQSILYTQNMRHLANVVKELPLLTDLTLTLQDSQQASRPQEVFAAIISTPLPKITVVLQRRAPQAEQIARFVAMTPPDAMLVPRWNDRDFEMHITQTAARCETNAKRARRLLMY